MQPLVPLWDIDFVTEPRNYFLDNDPYTFELLAEIIKLRYYTNPLEGTFEAEAGVHVLEIMEHSVYFTFENSSIVVLVVKPD